MKGRGQCMACVVGLDGHVCGLQRKVARGTGKRPEPCTSWKDCLNVTLSLCPAVPESLSWPGAELGGGGEAWVWKRAGVGETGKRLQQQFWQRDGDPDEGGDLSPLPASGLTLTLEK